MKAERCLERTRFILKTDGLKRDFPENFYGFVATIKNHYKTGYWIRLHKKDGRSTGLFWRREIPICCGCFEQSGRCICER